MTEFFLYCIATVGITSIIIHGNILAPFRQMIGDWAEKVRERRELKMQATGKLPRRRFVEWLNELINCAQCTGFWCGLFCGMILVPPVEFVVAHSNDLSVLYSFFRLFCCGLGGSFLAPLGINLIDWIFYRKMNALRQLEEQDLTLTERRAALETNLLETQE